VPLTAAQRQAVIPAAAVADVSLRARRIATTSKSRYSPTICAWLQQALMLACAYPRSSRGRLRRRAEGGAGSGVLRRRLV